MKSIRAIQCTVAAWLAFGCVASTAFAAEAVQQTEMQIRDEIDGKTRALFYAQRWVELDRLYTQYVDRSERTSSGLWKSTILYTELENRLGRHADADGMPVLQSAIAEWRKQQPRSKLAVLAEAALYSQRGWRIRGGGFSSNVRSEAWKPFHEWQERAERLLESESKTLSALPDYYTLSIDVKKALGKDPQAVFDEGIARFPGYYEIYFSMLAYLTPRWHGNASEIERFARKATEVSRSTDGDGMYARIYWFASQAEYGTKLFAESRVDWPRMRKGFDAVVARYPDQWNLQNFAKFACHAKDMDTLSRLFDRIVEPPIETAWGDEATYRTCKRMVRLDS